MKTKIALLAGLLVWDVAVAGWSKSQPPPAGAVRANQTVLECDDNYLRGDFTRERNRDREDVKILLNCLFVNPRGPYCLTCVGDMNCDERLTQADASILIFLVGTGSMAQIVCSLPPPVGM